MAAPFKAAFLSDGWILGLEVHRSNHGVLVAGSDARILAARNVATNIEAESGRSAPCGRRRKGRAVNRTRAPDGTGVSAGGTGRGSRRLVELVGEEVAARSVFQAPRAGKIVALVERDGGRATLQAGERYGARRGKRDAARAVGADRIVAAEGDRRGRDRAIAVYGRVGAHGRRARRKCPAQRGRC